MSRGWAKTSACRLQMTLSCAVLCHIVSLQYLSRSSLHRLAGLPCRIFFSYGLQVVSILLSILVCAAASLFCACLVSVQVSVPYVIAGSTQELYTSLFRQMARLLLKISRCLAYAAQPAMILRCISLSWFFSLRLYCNVVPSTGSLGHFLSAHCSRL